MDDIEQKVTKIIAEYLDLKEESFAHHDKFSDLGADSLDAVELIMAVEDAFGVEVTDEEAQSLTTTNAVVELLRSKLTK